MKKVVVRLWLTVKGIVREALGGARIASGLPSTARVVVDVVLYRALRLGSIPGENRIRTINLKSGESLRYRLNRGDIQSIREVMIDEVYRPPFKMCPRVIVDLGANIGLTSVYLNRMFCPDVLIAVEPDAANAAIARENLVPIGASVLEAAVGPQEGFGIFSASRDSNLGALGRSVEGRRVRLITMNSILVSLPEGRIDLLKIDIEGGEQEVLTGDTAWLASIGSIIIEFHPDRVDYPALVQCLIDAGFRYIPAGSAWKGSMDSFVRDSWSPRERGM